MKKESLSRIIRVLENSSSDDQTRYILNTVVITKEEIYATDGHILAVVKHKDDAFLGVDKIFISREQLPYLKLILKASSRHQKLILNVNVGPKTLEIDNKLVSVDIETLGKYPDISQFLPKDQETQKISFDVELLENLVMALRNDKKKVITLEIKLNRDLKTKDVTFDNLAPFKITTDGNTGVLMPCRA